MVHNGIEYGMMASYAEGLNILHNADVGKQHRQADAETAPLRDAKYYQYDLDIPEVAEVWRRGSVVASWLLDLTAHALSENHDLSDFDGRVSDSGEGRWTIHAAVDEGVPADVLERGAVRALHVARRRRLRRPAAVGDAQGVRGARREARSDDRRDQMRATDPSDALVFFGMTGDLARKKIFPALYAMVKKGVLDVPVIGVASSQWTVDDLRQRARDSITQYGGGVDDEDAYEKLTSLLRYIDGNYNEKTTYRRLKKELTGSNRPAHYLAIPPSMFEKVVEGLGSSSCAENARVIVEKPFGRDLESAQELNQVLHSVFPEKDIFRIDHYLGKEAIQNLIYLRFANSFLEPIWNRNYVRSVQVTMAEDFGVQGRGKFYEEVGALRDVIENHLFQTVALLAMEPPVGPGVEELRDSKEGVFDAIETLKPDDLVRGQYEGYRDEDGVAPDSDVETFAAVRLHIDSWRWAGVPFYVRAGKYLPCTCTEVRVELHRPPTNVFSEFEQLPFETNYFRFQLNPRISDRDRCPGQGLGRRLPRRERGAVPLQRSSRRRRRRTSGSSRTRCTARPCCSPAKTASSRRGEWSTTSSSTTAPRSRTTAKRWGPEEQYRLLEDPEEVWHEPMADS